MKNDAGEVVDLYLPRKWYAYMCIEMQINDINNNIFIY